MTSMAYDCDTPAYTGVWWFAPGECVEQAKNEIPGKCVIYVQGGPKKVSHEVLSISLSNIDRFSTFFHWRILWKMCNQMVTKHTTTP